MLLPSLDTALLESLAFRSLGFPARLTDEQGEVLWANDTFISVQSLLEVDKTFAAELKHIVKTVSTSRENQEMMSSDYRVRCVFVSDNSLCGVLSIFQNLADVRELKKNLDDSRAALQTYLNNSFEMMARIDVTPPLDSRWPLERQVEHFIEHAVIGDCNDYYARFYGYENRGEIIGRELPYFKSKEEYRIAAMDLAQGQFEVSRQKLLQHSVLNSKDLWVEYSSRGIWEGSLFYGFWATQRDITELVDQQSELKLRDERYRNFVSNSSDAVGRVEILPSVSRLLPKDDQIRLIAERMCIAECNEAWAEQYHSSISELIGRKQCEFEPLIEVELGVRQFVDQGYNIRSFKHKVEVKGQGLMWQRYSASPIFSGDELQGLWITQQDITELELKNIALEQSEDRHRGFFLSNFTPSVRMRLDKPMPISLPKDEQVRWLLENVRFCNVNRALAEWVGAGDPTEFEGKLLKDLSVSSDTDEEIWRAFVSENYHLKGREWHVSFDDGTDVYFLSEHRGTIEGEHLVEVWASYQDMTEARKHLQDMEHQAHHDGLTGLPNRTALHEYLDQQLLVSTLKEPLALLFIDLDLFKEVNDALGHHAGDELLKLLGPRLEEVAADYENSLVARLGGDEFAVSAVVSGAREAHLLAEQLLQKIKQVFDLDGVNVHVGGSIGIALSPQDSRDVVDLMRCADVAMYRAKINRMGFAHYNAEEDQQSSRRLELLSDLRAALEANSTELQLYYQPKINLENGQWCGVEALIRWFHPEHGFISPGEFIPIAETTDLVHPLTQWVLNRALQQWKTYWHEKKLTVAVNFSTRNLLNPKIVNMIRDALLRNELPGEALEVEITESALMQNPTQALSVLKQIRELGVSVAIDDFGTGYSSLAYLKNLPVNVLKIDFVFVRELLENAEDKVIVNSVIQLGQNFGLKVVAEGVESAEAQALLKTMGCDLAQGYHIAKPMPMCEIEKWST